MKTEKKRAEGREQKGKEVEKLKKGEGSIAGQTQRSKSVRRCGG